MTPFLCSEKENGDAREEGTAVSCNGWLSGRRPSELNYYGDGAREEEKHRRLSNGKLGRRPFDLGISSDDTREEERCRRFKHGWLLGGGHPIFWKRATMPGRKRGIAAQVTDTPGRRRGTSEP